VLGRVGGADRGLDAELGQRPLPHRGDLVAGIAVEQDLEGERPAVRADHAMVAELVSRGPERLITLAQEGPVVAATVGNRRSPFTLQYVRLDGVRVGLQQFPFRRARLYAVRGEHRTVEIALRALVGAGEEVAVGPFEIEQVRQRGAYF